MAMQFKRRSFGPKKSVSLFTLGTMRAIESFEEMYSVVKEAALIGINHIETAPIYGPSELLLGQSIKKLDEEKIFPKDKWIITSKVLPGKSFEEGKEDVKRILNNISIQKIDNLAIHGINIFDHLIWATTGEGSALLQWAKSEALVDQVGFSSHGSTSLIREAIESKKFDFCNLHIHLLKQNNLPLAKLALKNGMGVLAISPADKGGHLQFPSEKLIEDCWPIPPLELAYRFLLAQGISTLTLGAKTAKDFDIAKKLINSSSPLTALENNCIINLYNAKRLRLEGTMCGQCQECLPCPNNVPIPSLLQLRNLYIGHELKSFAKERYNLIGKAGHWWEEVNASACNNCGECLPRCPNKLNIPVLLKQAHLQLKDSPIRRLWG